MIITIPINAISEPSSYEQSLKDFSERVNVFECASNELSRICGNRKHGGAHLYRSTSVINPEIIFR